MKEEIQGPSGPHLQANVNPLEDAERKAQELEDPGFGAPGTAPALEDESTE